MYSDWSSLSLQLQCLGSSTQSVLSKLPQDDSKQVSLKIHYYYSKKGDIIFVYQIALKRTFHNVFLTTYKKSFSQHENTN